MASSILPSPLMPCRFLKACIFLRRESALPTLSLATMACCRHSQSVMDVNEAQELGILAGRSLNRTGPFQFHCAKKAPKEAIMTTTTTRRMRSGYSPRATRMAGTISMFVVVETKDEARLRRSTKMTIHPSWFRI